MAHPLCKISSALRALCAEPMDLGIPVFHLEILRGNLLIQAFGQMAQMGLGNVPARIANQKLRAGMRMVIATDRVGVQTFDLMNEARLQPELNGAIDGRRFGIVERFTQIFKQLISTHGFLMSKKGFENTLTHGRQPQTLLLTELLNGFELRFGVTCHDVSKLSLKTRICKYRPYTGARAQHFELHAAHDGDGHARQCHGE